MTKFSVKRPAPKKVPTENWSLGDAWDGFKAKYLKFVDWIRTDEEDNAFYCDIKFLEDSPEEFENKWQRKQHKIRVEQADVEEQHRMLAAGDRLFSTIKEVCDETKRTPKELGLVRLYRKGSGFDTRYEILFPSK